ncbi:MAG: ATP-binding protein, partial [Phenylobacterium sp.]
MPPNPYLRSVDPSGEAQRLVLLQALNLLDTPPERAFDNIVALVRTTLRTPIALVCFVDDRRQWFKAKLGLDVAETSRSDSLCTTTIEEPGVLWVEDARADLRFAQSPLVLGPPNVVFYAGAPISVRGQRIGTVCAISENPRTYDAAQAEILTMLANLAADECERRLVTLEIEAARHQAADASRAKSQFLATVSHELRTPLNGVIGVASVLAATGLDADQRELVDIIRGSGEALRDSLDDILDISKIEAGRFDLGLRPFRLGEVVRQALESSRARAEDKGLALTFESETDAVYLGDGPRIRKIISSLVSNAVKFTLVGEVGVRVGCVAMAQGDRLTIEVRDTGPGFAAAIQERMFSRYEQGEESATRRYGGAGLGLPISRSLAELMGGTLVAVSGIGGGATFTLSLELQRTESEEGAGAVLPLPHALPSQKVLVADDNATNRRVVELILTAADVAVTCVADGAEAVKAFEHGDWDFVFM